MPATIHPMLAESVEKPFDGAEWLFEIKWDGYRAIAFIERTGKVRLVSRNQNDLTPRYPELKDCRASSRRRRRFWMAKWWRSMKTGKASFQFDAAAHGISSRRKAVPLRTLMCPCCTTRSICCISTATTGGVFRWRSASASWRRWWWRATSCATPIITKTRQGPV
jgi:hypothetical protein